MVLKGGIMDLNIVNTICFIVIAITLVVIAVRGR
jgi:hypothetical protein